MARRFCKQTVARAFSALVLSVLIGACGEEPQAPPGAEAGGAPQALPVAVVEAQPTQVPITLEAVGETEGVREVEIRARVGGILERRLYTEGEPVEANQPLFQIDPKPFEIALAQAKANLAQQQANLEQARREAKRLGELVDQNAISRRDYDTAMSELELSQASVQAAQAGVREAELNLSYTTVRAPVGGVTDRAYQFEGALIDINGESGLLTRIYQINPIRARFSLPYSAMADLPEGQLTPENVKGVQLILPSGETYPHHGKLDFGASAINPQLGTVQFRAEFPNEERGLLPGEFVRVRVVVGEQEGVYLIPQIAVMQSAQGSFVYVVRDGKATIQPVQTGEWHGQDWVIQKGLKPGDQVIINNLIKVRPEAPVTVVPEAEGEQTAEAPKG